ncbi:hypothetical protein EZY14_016705 [Kordia sp. TARA_039_SRF]|nr:hypothetical protein EZY14_016705 [Kordia sp. TARA_039_SRF]
MDKKILYVLSLKFKRHNLAFNFDEQTQALILGKNLKLKRKYLIGTLIIVFTLIISFILISFGMRLRLLLILPIILGGYIITNALSLSRNNKFEKIFSTNSIKLVSKEDSIEYKKNDIKKLDYFIYSGETDKVKGRLFLYLKDNTEIELLTLLDKDRKFLKSDFEYLINILNKHLDLMK